MSKEQWFFSYEQRLNNALAEAERDYKCLYCQHLKSNHDTGWDAAGCMVAMCTCRGYK
jgi:hypothetical protein